MFLSRGNMKYKSWDDRLVKTFCQSCDNLYHCNDPCDRYMLAAEMAELLDSIAYIIENVTKTVVISNVV